MQDTAMMPCRSSSHPPVPPYLFFLILFELVGSCLNSISYIIIISVARSIHLYPGAAWSCNQFTTAVEVKHLYLGTCTPVLLWLFSLFCGSSPGCCSLSRFVCCHPPPSWFIAFLNSERAEKCYILIPNATSRGDPACLPIKPIK